jgi:hypothetical protein
MQRIKRLTRCDCIASGNYSLHSAAASNFQHTPTYLLVFDHNGGGIKLI